MEIVELQRVVGAENAVVGDATGEYQVNGLAPRAVVAPASRDEAVEVIRVAAAQGWSLVPFGGGTQIALGSRPERLDLVLSTRRMDRILDYQPDDMTVTLEPGVTLSELQRVLAERRQFLPLNPWLPDRATVGGTVASAAFGPWCAGHGSPRDWVIGCRVIGADTREVRAGGLVVKNVAGYDLPKLYTGSFGTLGFLSEITFKVMPIPGVAGYSTVPLGNATEAEALLTAIRASGLQPSVLELVSAGASGDSAWGSLFLQFLHVPEAVEWQQQHLSELAARHRLEARRLPEGAGAGMLVAYRDQPASLPFVARIGTLSSRVAEVSAKAAEIVRQHGQSPEFVAHAAFGRVYVCAGGGDAGLVTAVRALADSVGAVCVFPRLPAELTGTVDPWGAVGPEARLMRGIKATLDPQGVFAPGRFVAGI
jgi:glycolate oxidase FAD binding subunit